MSKILIVEDDEAIVESLREYLGKEGYNTVAVAGELSAKEALKKESINLLLVDISLNDGTGFGVCKYAKELKLPVIFLTASDDEASVVRGLDMGADDYISKPFRPRELISRIKNILRRYGSDQSIIAIENITIDTEKGEVKKDGEALNLSALEYKLLTILINNRGILLTRAKLLEEIWDIAGDFVNDNTLTVYIKRLREKVEADPQNPSIIKTVRGIGYRVD